MSETPDNQGQEGAEAYDALLENEGAGDLQDRTFEELPDVEDLTQAEGDADEDEAVALDASEFDPDAIDDSDTQDDDELNYRAATDEHEDDIDGQGPGDGSDEDLVPRTDVEGAALTADAGSVEGGEDDFSNFEADQVTDEDLADLGYSDATGRARGTKP